MSDTNTKQKSMTTWIRVYDLIKFDCPEGASIENCPLRQELAKMPKNEHMESKTLENGDLMAPYYLIGEQGPLHTKSLCTRICNECINKQR